MMLIITENTGNTSKVILITEKNRNDIAKKRFINLQKKEKKICKGFENGQMVSQ